MSERGEFGEIAGIWPKFGLLIRLHKIVRYIRMTPQRRQEFRRCLNDVSLKRFDKLEMSGKTYGKESILGCQICVKRTITTFLARIRFCGPWCCSLVRFIAPRSLTVLVHKYVALGPL